MAAVDEHLLAEIDGFVEPGQGRFQGGEVRGLLVGDGQVADLEAGGGLDVVQVAEFRAQVEDGGHALGNGQVHAVAKRKEAVRNEHGAKQSALVLFGHAGAGESLIDQMHAKTTA